MSEENIVEKGDNTPAIDSSIDISRRTEKESRNSDPHDLHEEQALPTWRLILLGLSVSIGLFLSFLDTSIVATSLVAIGTDFDNVEEINWVALAYTLSYLAFTTVVARVSDVVGRRDAFLGSYIVFITISIGCGFAQSLNQLIALRAVQGFAASGLYSLSMIILPEIVPRSWRHILASIIGLIITLASVLGPVLGGVFTRYASWHWIFWINGPIGAVSTTLFLLAWPKPQYLPYSQRRSWRDLDYFGSVLLIAAAVLVVYPFQNASSGVDQWSKVVFFVPLILGLLAWIAIFAWSLFIEKRWGDGIAAAVPMRLLRDRVYASAVVNTMLLGFPYILLIYAFAQRLQVVNGKDALIAGVMLLPALAASAVGSAISGRINGHKDRAFETLVVAASSMLLGCGLLSTLSDSKAVEPKALGFLVFIGFGFGLSVATSTMIASFRSSAKDHATAQGIVAQVRVLGGSLGIAATSAILGVTLQSQIGASATADEISALVAGGGIGTDSTQLAAIRRAYSDAFREDMRVCAIISGVAILSTIGTYSRNRSTWERMRDGQMEAGEEHRGESVCSQHRDGEPLS
ncbi:major facilitator superfamily transporter [Xylariaceae sp. FL1272]|nr:major facilitator superfamily transporter [Xylariaceae sp. FL1272]